MIICHFCHRFIPQLGGVELSVASLAAAQSALGHDVTVVTETPESDTWLALKHKATSIRIVPHRPFTRLLYWKWMWSRRAFFRSCDVLHFHDYGTFFNWYLPLKLLVRRPVYAMTFHGFDGWPIQKSHKIRRCITAAMMDVRIGVGDYLAHYYSEKYSAVILGAPVHNIAQAAHSGSENGRPLRFLHMGRLEPDTGIDVVVRALSNVAKRRGVAAHLDIAGDGRLRGAIEMSESEYLSITFNGWIDDPGKLLNNADVCIGTGFLSIFDAFQAGVPVVLPALTEVKNRYFHSIPSIESMAYLATSVDSLEEIIDRLILHEQTDDMEEKCGRASEYVMTLEWPEIASRLNTLYAEGRQ
jgi:glycosyltransferase involved in cell wall biosynthesis